MSKFRVHAMSKPFFGFDITWALKNFFSQTIELRTLSPNFDSHKITFSYQALEGEWL
jgi:hypothetical protein